MVFGVETALWQVKVRREGEWSRGVLESAERFMIRWHEDEATQSRQRQPSTLCGVTVEGETAVDESRKEMSDRVVARYQPN